MTDRDPRPDEQLFSVRLHEQPALDELLRRYLGDLYDFALRLSLDGELARGAVANIVASLDAPVTQLPAAISFRAWIFGQVRSVVLEELARRGRGGEEDAGAESQVSIRHPDLAKPPPGAVSAEAAGWAWEAARAERPRDFSLLALSLRYGLTPAEVANVAGLSRSSVYTVLGRLRGAFEQGFASAYLYHRGRAACAEVAAIAPEADELAPALRRKLARHAEGCLDCCQTLAALPLAAEIFAGLQQAPTPAELGWSGRAQVPPADGAPQISSGPFQFSLVTPPQEDAPAFPEPEVFQPDQGEHVWEEEIIHLPAETWPEAPNEEDVEAFSPVEASSPGRREQGTEPGAAPGAHVPEPPQVENVEPIQMGGGSGQGPPPHGPWVVFLAWYRGQEPKRLWLMVAGLGAVLLALYIGVALGDSIETNGSSARAVAPLPTKLPEAQELLCGTGPITVDQGASYTLSFDAKTLPGFKTRSVTVTSVSAQASVDNVSARAQEGVSVLFEARRVPGSAGRIDEYRLTVTFEKADERSASICQVLVRGPEPTATPAPTSTTPPSPTPPPLPTATPTSAAPTSTPTTQPSATPTAAATATQTATAAPTLTATASPTASVTATATPSATPTLTPTPTP